jgi:ribose-phosphate pyrophosphokinase
MNQIKIFSGTSNQPLALNIAIHCGVELGNIYHHDFPSGEKYCQYRENIRGCDVFLIQSLNKPVNDNLMELLLMLDAARRASAGRITAVLPYMGYMRQDRKTGPREPISAKLVMDLIVKSGADRVLTMDLHNPSIQGFLNKPLDHLFAMPIFVEYLHNNFKPQNTIVIGPDVGSVKRGSAFAEYLGVDFGFATKDRIADDQVEHKSLVGDVAGKDVIIVDDMAESCSTVIEVAKICRKQSAKTVRAVLTHPLFTRRGWDNIIENKGLVDEWITTDTVYSNSDCLTKLTVARSFASAIHAIHTDKSISDMSEIKGY